MSPHIEQIAGVDVFRIENNPGVHWDDVIRSRESLNDVPVRVYKDRVDASGVFSNKQLRVALDIGHIICDPLPTTEVNGSSVDVRLGNYFYLAGNPRNIRGILQSFDEQDTHRYFGKAKEAKAARIVIKKALENLGYLIESGTINEQQYARRREYIHDTDEIKNLDPDHPIILLRPNERILAHTQEFIGIKSPGTTSMQTRSTIGRIGVATCFCAGWGDPGYVNRWTMEINNLNEFEYIPIALGQRVAQIVFSGTGPVEGEYSVDTGKYQLSSSDDIDSIKAEWTPDMILPRQHKDIAELETWRRAHTE